MKKIISIVGARPNFIKLAALSPQLQNNFKHVILHTGQHYDYELSNNLFKELKIKKPNYNLGVGSASHAQQTASIIQKTEKILINEKPDLVIVYGDTNSTLGGALAAAKLNVPIAHVEAGDRCGNKEVPEEVNRIVADHLSSMLFASTKSALSNLKKEGLKNASYTGDLMIDTIKLAKVQEAKILKKFKIKVGNYIYSTIHRAQNTDNVKRLKNILNSLEDLDYKVIIPLHPRTRKVLEDSKISISKFENIIFSKPIPYRTSLTLIKYAKFAITDSGGVQKEAYWFKTPCITIRNEIEEDNLCKLGWVYLLKPANNLNHLKSITTKFSLPHRHPNFYGTGHAAKTITNLIKSYLSP